MKIPSQLARALGAAAISAGVVAGLAGTVGPAGASPPSAFFGFRAHAVFVQTDNPAGNQVVAYLRGPGGQLVQSGTYDTGGVGGVLSGSVVDHQASQGSLTYDPVHGLLYATNAGSNTVSVFAVHGAQLSLVQVLSSGGSFPVSVTASGNSVYVLNAEDGGSVQGFGLFWDHLFPLPGSNRGLGLNPTATPQFTNTPGQVAFTPNGSHLIVTTKANGSDIDVFGVGPFGALSPAPVVNSEPGTVPFGVTFDASGNLVVAEAGPDALATYRIEPSGMLVPVASVPDGQAATCWVVGTRNLYFAENAGSATVSTFEGGPFGSLALIGNTSTDPGTVDATVSPDGQYLYVQTGGNGAVDEFGIGFDGSLRPIGSVLVPGAVGGEGIAST
jgi:6-phosphogluconolactonase (cycloisomerase 2 family)